MPTPRTLTITQAATAVRAKVNLALVSLDEGGDTEASRQQMTRYFSRTRAASMMSNILADATTETPTDVRATFESQAQTILENAIYQAAL
jgi:hypothetical protein